jgi:uncharacterized protein (TIGR01777 family)
MAGRQTYLGFEHVQINMKIVIPGGSGHLGRMLAGAFWRDHEVVVLSRSPQLSSPWRTVLWDGRNLGPWAAEIDGAAVVVNLAGRSVNCRYTPRNRQEILQSRVDSTLVVGEAIRQARRPPRLWLQASTATIYAHTFGAAHDERGAIGGSEEDAPEEWGFSIDVARAWECAADEKATPRTRLVKLRSAIVMSAHRGGAFDMLLRLVRYGVGGAAGDGRQFVSWIHEADFVRAIGWLIEHDEISGAVNVAAPNPLPNADFMRVLREAWPVRFGLRATQWMLELGAAFIGTETELILKSRRVVPGRLLQSGFVFEFPLWEDAARDLCQTRRMQWSSEAMRSTSF